MARAGQFVNGASQAVSISNSTVQYSLDKRQKINGILSSARGSVGQTIHDTREYEFLGSPDAIHRQAAIPVGFQYGFGFNDLDFNKIKCYEKYLSLFIISFATSACWSQGLRLNLYGHYVFDDQVESYYNSTNYFHGLVKGGFQGGGSLEFRVHDYYGVELLYLRQKTTVPVDYYDISSGREKNPTLDLNINWITMAGMRSQKVK